MNYIEAQNEEMWKRQEKESQPPEYLDLVEQVRKHEQELSATRGLVDRLQSIKTETEETINREYRGLDQTIPLSYICTRAVMYGIAIPCISKQDLFINMMGCVILLIGEVGSYQFRRYQAKAEALRANVNLLEKLLLK